MSSLSPLRFLERLCPQKAPGSSTPNPPAASPKPLAEHRAPHKPRERGSAGRARAEGADRAGRRGSGPHARAAPPGTGSHVQSPASPRYAPSGRGLAQHNLIRR